MDDATTDDEAAKIAARLARLSEEGVADDARLMRILADRKARRRTGARVPTNSTPTEERTMTASDKLKHLILKTAGVEAADTPEAVRAAWNDHGGEDDVGDAKSEVRSGQYRTGLPCPSSRHYESEAVAAQAPDGSWIGWVYWFGGGKHGEPGAMPWVEDAYDLEMTEVPTVVKKFTRKGA